MAVIPMVAEEGPSPALFGISRGIFSRAAVHHARHSESRDGSSLG
jgi:hypothetical protein